MIGDLYIVRKTQPDQLKALTYRELHYFHEWHRLAQDAEDQEAERIKNQK